VAQHSQQVRPKRTLKVWGATLIVASFATVGLGIAPAYASDEIPEPIITEEAAPADTTGSVVEEEVVPEETPAVVEEEVIEESVPSQSFSTQAAKNDGEQGQETCPDGGGWLKIEPIDALTYEYTAPSGQLIAEVCYKASTDVIYIDIEDAASYEFVSTVTNKNGELQEISHVSVRLITEEPTPPTGNAQNICVEVDEGIEAEFSATGEDGSTPVNHYTLVDGVLVDTDEGSPSETYGFSELVSVLTGKGEGQTYTAEVRAGDTLESSIVVFAETTFTIDCEDDTPPPPPPGEDPDPVDELANTGPITWPLIPAGLIGIAVGAGLIWLNSRRQSGVGVLAQ
jgi:hypothetical protein